MFCCCLRQFSEHNTQIFAFRDGAGEVFWEATLLCFARLLLCERDEMDQSLPSWWEVQDGMSGVE